MIYYINAGSSTEDGLTPTTGFHNLDDLLAVITLVEGDTIELVDNGTIDDSGQASLLIDVGITFKSWNGNVAKPSWVLPTDELLIVGGTYFNAYDVQISTENGSVISFNGDYVNYDISTIDLSCENIDIERCHFTGLASAAD